MTVGIWWFRASVLLSDSTFVDVSRKSPIFTIFNRFHVFFFRNNSSTHSVFGVVNGLFSVIVFRPSSCAKKKKHARRIPGGTLSPPFENHRLSVLQTVVCGSVYICINFGKKKPPHILFQTSENQHITNVDRYRGIPFERGKCRRKPCKIIIRFGGFRNTAVCRKQKRNLFKRFRRVRPQSNYRYFIYGRFTRYKIYSTACIEFLKIERDEE